MVYISKNYQVQKNKKSVNMALKKLPSSLASERFSQIVSITKSDLSLFDKLTKDPDRSNRNGASSVRNTLIGIVLDVMKTSHLKNNSTCHLLLQSSATFSDGSEKSLVRKAKTLFCSVSWNLTSLSLSGYFLREASSTNSISASPSTFSGMRLFHLTHLNFRFCFALTTKNDSRRLILKSSAKALQPRSKTQYEPDSYGMADMAFESWTDAVVI